jgi:hypothetical protein
MTERMTPQEIVKNSTEIKEAGADWKVAYATLHQSIASNKYRVLRNGNTLFWIRIDSPGVAQMYVFNADSYKNLFRNMKEFAKAMNAAGYKKVYGETSDMNILNLIKRIGFPVDIERIGVDRKGRPLYRGTVNV